MAQVHLKTGIMEGMRPLTLTAVVLAAAALLSACNAGKSDTVEPIVGSTECAGTYSGRIDPPPQNIRIANRDRQIAEGGILGGGVDGGIYLEGAFGWQTDANCNIIAGNMILHGGYTNVTGNVKAVGTSNINHDGGPVEVIRNGTAISGKVMEGGGREWVYGDLVGVFTPGGKL